MTGGKQKALNVLVQNSSHLEGNPDVQISNTIDGIAVSSSSKAASMSQVSSDDVDGDDVIEQIETSLPREKFDMYAIVACHLTELSSSSRLPTEDIDSSTVSGTEYNEMSPSTLNLSH